MIMRCSLAALSAGTLTSTALAATLVVDPAGSTGFTTVQAAINASANGDTILVRPGTYPEALAVGGKLLTIRGDGAANSVVLRSPKGGTMMRLENGETSALRFEQLTFTGGTSASLIEIVNANPVFERCIFRDNLRSAVVEARACSDTGGGTYRFCLFLQNSQSNGGAMYLLHSNTVIEDCAFVNNTATGPTSGVNAGGAVYVNDWTCGQHTFAFTRCVFANNSAVWGGAIYSQGIFPNATTQMPIIDCVFVGNSASQGAAMWNWYISAPVSGSWFCGSSDQIRNAWTNAGGNQFNAGCFVLPYADCDGDKIPDPLEISLGLASDCDGDGVTDACEIASGTAADANANGIPDSCETLQVPSQYPTIQAAIDAVGPGTPRIVAVAAGTYNESFSLNSKDVVVRGAADSATILDGTGLTASIARFTGDEPATAGVESLVFRAGTSGSLIYPEAPFNVGGAIYGINSAASIRNCRFESCASDFGGAVYLIYSRPTVANCVFDDNTAINEGGGLFLYECTSTVSGCSFTNNDASIKSAGAASAFKAVGARATGEVVELNSCTFSGNRGLLSGSAIEYYENVQSNPGVLRISGCTITANVSGITVPEGAAGLRVLGRSTSCVITGGTSICSNSPRDTSGPFLIEGSASVCGCFADITGDGLVNGGDLGALLGAWGIAGPTGVGDVNHDGLVDAQDLGILLSSWGACPN
jgi:predicted outer membrane repeat protein